jgi:CheY-like chemotaxis protein
MKWPKNHERKRMSTEKGCRPVQICVAMDEKSPVRCAIEHVFGVVGEPESHCFVKSIGEADLVIFDEVRTIETDYSVSKVYALLDKFGNRPKNLPHNVTDVLKAENLVVELSNLIQKVWLGLKPLDAPKPETVIPETPLRPDAMRILVIEDTPKHQESAKIGLAGHRLTVVTGYEEAMKFLGSEKFDIVLTDLQMPMSSQTLGQDAFKLGQLVPYGIMLMIEAAHRGAKFVAVVTDLNHHADWLSAAFDHFHYSVQIEKAKVLMMHSPMNADGTKDWAAALERLMKA